MNTYVQHEEKRITVAITDANGDAATPSTLTFWAVKGDGTAVGPYTLADDELLTLGTGSYAVDLYLDTPGIWHYGARSTGPYAAAQGRLRVQKAKA